MGRYFAIDPEGNIFHCDEFMFDSRYRIGNLRELDFEDLEGGLVMQELKKRNTEQIDQLVCPWLPICNGGCPKDRYVQASFGGDSKCCGYADLIQHISSRISADEQVAKWLRFRVALSDDQREQGAPVAISRFA